MKKLLVSILAVVLCLCLFGCSTTEQPGPTTSSDVVSITETIETEEPVKDESSSDSDSSPSISDDSSPSNSIPNGTDKTSSTTSHTENKNKTETPTSTSKVEKPSSKPETTDKKEANSNNSTTTPPQTEPAKPLEYEKFGYSIGVYESKNIEKKEGSEDYYAYLSVYSTKKDSDQYSSFKNKFSDIFGYEPVDTIECKELGTFVVTGFDKPTKVYQLTVYDDTYPLITDEFYVVKKKICADGSAWVGFPMPCSLDDMDTSERARKLLSEMNSTFCEWTGYDYAYITANEDKFMVNMISQAGLMRTLDGKVTQVVYRYTRGVNMPV